jgi:uncharacterized protein
MIRRFVLFAAALLFLPTVAAFAQNGSFRVLALYSTNVESDHVDFAKQALQFFAENASKNHYQFESSTQWDDLTKPSLTQYQVIVWLNDFPHTPEQRKAFEAYMTHGGGWLGFHVSAYNDKDTHWPWFVDFLGGGVFYGNNWPPLPATLQVDDPSHPVTKTLPAKFTAPANEWYIWKPSPRLNKDIKVLLTLDSANYPIGLKDAITAGDLPVVWTNTRYRMLYMNMGHGDKIFTSPTQNHLFENAILWLGNNH